MANLAGEALPVPSTAFFIALPLGVRTVAMSSQLDEICVKKDNVGETETERKRSRKSGGQLCDVGSDRHGKT